VSLVGVWAFHFLILGGVEEATYINKIVTVARAVSGRVESAGVPNALEK